jgi:hypothetical protein
MQLNEDSLNAGDLRDLVDHIFEVDNYKSKMGDDDDVVVLSFTVEGKDPADDLVNFIEKGYAFVLDADMTPGELSNGKYRVFVEIERNRKVAEQITDMLYGISKLTDIENFKFRYHKSFNSVDAVKEKLDELIPNSPQAYQAYINEKNLNTVDGFFGSNMMDSVKVEGDLIEFKKIYAEPIKFKVLNYGDTKTVLENIEDRIAVEMNDMADVMFLTKYIGNFNITKLGKKYMFENQGHAVLMEKL